MEGRHEEQVYSLLDWVWAKKPTPCIDATNKQTYAMLPGRHWRKYGHGSPEYGVQKPFGEGCMVQTAVGIAKTSCSCQMMFFGKDWTAIGNMWELPGTLSIITGIADHILENPQWLVDKSASLQHLPKLEYSCRNSGCSKTSCEETEEIKNVT